MGAGEGGDSAVEHPVRDLKDRHLSHRLQRTGRE